VGLKLNGTNESLVYAEDTNPLRDDIRVHTIQKHTEALTDASKEAGLEVTQS
jgi:hypothetical protein